MANSYVMHIWTYRNKHAKVECWLITGTNIISVRGFFLRPALYNKNGATRLSRIIRIKSQEEMPFTCLIHVVPCSFFVIQQDWRSICCSSVELTVLPPPLHKTRQSSCCTRLVPGQGCENSTPPKTTIYLQHNSAPSVTPKKAPQKNTRPASTQIAWNGIFFFCSLLEFAKIGCTSHPKIPP